MTYETNIVALAENEFLENTRRLMEKRDTAFSLYQWVVDSLREGKHVDEIGTRTLHLRCSSRVVLRLDDK